MTAKTKLPFIKMNGLGNDFVILDGREHTIELTKAGAARLASRTDGLGCDQLIVMEPGAGAADLTMRIFNNDGGEVDACGNATRCIAWLMEQQQAGAQSNPQSGKTWTIRTNAGLLKANVDGIMVSVDMGVPSFDWQKIPLAHSMDTMALDIPLEENWNLPAPSAVNVGNPHCIFFVGDAFAHNLEKIGPAIEHHPLFPQRTNVELAEVMDRQSIRLRVWERGVGITKACGTGACATLPAAVRKGLTDRKVTVKLDGGDLVIEWRSDDSHIIMTGPTAFDYEGTADIDMVESAP